MKYLKPLSLILFLSCATSENLQTFQLSSQIPHEGKTESVGSYSSGCLIGAKSIPPDGNGYSMMRLSRGRFWGHTNLTNFILKLSKNYQSTRNQKILISDLSHAKGGPNLTGHKSHQTGLDVDIWMTSMPHDSILSLSQRETKSASSVISPIDQSLNLSKFDQNQIELLKLITQDQFVQRVFVTPVIKKLFCNSRKSLNITDEQLKKIRPWWGHKDHYHVRLKCPENSKDCTPQKSPKKVGCDETLAWWFSEEAKPKKTSIDYLARYKETAQKLPKVCKDILQL